MYLFIITLISLTATFTWKETSRRSILVQNERSDNFHFGLVDQLFSICRHAFLLLQLHSIINNVLVNSLSLSLHLPLLFQYRIPDQDQSKASSITLLSSSTLIWAVSEWGEKIDIGQILNLLDRMSKQNLPISHLCTSSTKALIVETDGTKLSHYFKAKATVTDLHRHLTPTGINLNILMNPHP